MIKQLGLTVLLILCATSASSWADVHVAPLLAFDYWHRNAPEETDASRIAAGLNVTADTVARWPILELSAIYANNSDSFATQNSVDEKMWQFRIGGLYRIIPGDSPLLGVRLGLQWVAIDGSYQHTSADGFPLTDPEHPKYFTPYFGFVVGELPVAGFGVLEQVTFYYDPFFRSMFYQFAFGIQLR